MVGIEQVFDAVRITAGLLVKLADGACILLPAVDHLFFPVALDLAGHIRRHRHQRQGQNHQQEQDGQYGVAGLLFATASH